MPFSRGSSQPMNWTVVSCMAGRFFTSWATREAHQFVYCLWLSSYWNLRVFIADYSPPSPKYLMPVPLQAHTQVADPQYRRWSKCFWNVIKSPPNMNKLKHTQELTCRSCVRKKMIHCGNLKRLHIQKTELETEFKLSEYVKGLRRKYTIINSSQRYGKSSHPMKRSLQVWITWMEKKKSNQMWHEHFHLPFLFT